MIELIRFDESSISRIQPQNFLETISTESDLRHTIEKITNELVSQIKINPLELNLLIDEALVEWNSKFNNPPKSYDDLSLPDKIILGTQLKRKIVEVFGKHMVHKDEISLFNEVMESILVNYLEVL